LPVAHVIPLNVSEINEVVELIVDVELGNEPLLVGAEARIHDLLIPADCRLGEIDSTHLGLEGDVGRDHTRQVSGS
jgi:hypothetical protein